MADFTAEPPLSVYLPVAVMRVSEDEPPGALPLGGAPDGELALALAVEALLAVLETLDPQEASTIDATTAAEAALGKDFSWRIIVLPFVVLRRRGSERDWSTGGMPTSIHDAAGPVLRGG